MKLGAILTCNKGHVWVYLGTDQNAYLNFVRSAAETPPDSLLWTYRAKSTSALVLKFPAYTEMLAATTGMADIDELELTVRMRNLLRGAGINTVGEFRAMPVDQLGQLKGVTKRTMKEMLDIHEFLNAQNPGETPSSGAVLSGIVED